MALTTIRHHATAERVGLVSSYTDMSGRFRAVFQVYSFNGPKAAIPLHLEHEVSFSSEFPAICAWNNWRNDNRSED